MPVDHSRRSSSSQGYDQVVLGNSDNFSNWIPFLTRWFTCRTTETIPDNNPYLVAGSYYLRSEAGYKYEQNGRHDDPAFASGPVGAETILGEIIRLGDHPVRTFEVIPLSAPGPSMSIAIRAPNGKYVTSERDGYTSCDRTVRNDWETFTIENMPPEGVPIIALASSFRFRIKDWQGRYLAAGADVWGTRLICANPAQHESYYMQFVR